MLRFSSAWSLANNWFTTTEASCWQTIEQIKEAWSRKSQKQKQTVTEAVTEAVKLISNLSLVIKLALDYRIVVFINPSLMEPTGKRTIEFDEVERGFISTC